MVSSLQLPLAISFILYYCTALTSAEAAAAAHRDVAANSKCRRRRIQLGVDLIDDAVAAAYRRQIDHYPSTFRAAVTRHCGGGVQRDDQKTESFLKRHPFASAVTITTCNAVAADLFTQLIIHSNREWDMQRTVLLGAFGMLFQGCAQYTVVNVVWERLCPGTSPKSVIAKILGMNLVSDPLLFFPCFYIFQTFLEQRQLAVGPAMERYGQNCWSDWKNSWMVWFPGHGITYGVMPPHRRIPWMAFLSFFYMCILSFTRGGGTD